MGLLSKRLVASCVVSLAGTAAAQSARPAEEGSGAFPALLEEDATLADHVVYRPRDLAALKNRRLPLYVWGNGGCSADGTSSRNHLLEIASNGYLVVAAGTIPRPKPVPASERQGQPQGPRQLRAETPTTFLSDAIDWAIRENGRKGSAYYGRIATDHIAVSGWSCGGLQALNVASDPRVRTAIIMNSGFFPGTASPIAGIDNDKATLAKLHTPTLYVLGGKSDIAYENGMDDFRRIDHVPVAVINLPVGHGGTYMQPHGGAGAKVVTRWLDWQLKGDRKAAASFTGPSCGYCQDSRFTIERKKL